MFIDVLTKIFGSNNARQLKKLQATVTQINELEPAILLLTDDQLRAKTIEFKEQLAHGKSLDAVLPEAFAVVRETSRRKLGQRHYDVQLIGGIVLHQGKIAEMKTGEGKTLTATLALYLNALTGKGAQLVTVNDYLARRDAQWMAPIYEQLGLTVGILQNSSSDAQRKEAYTSDILYATNNELGFDYLRDNMKFRLSDYVQRELNYAIVDEVDSILIDEARTPLIISGSSDESSILYTQINRIIPGLTKTTDYEIDEKDRAVHLTESGNDKIERALSVTNLYAIEHIKLLHHVTQALKAHALFKKDVDYVVHDGEVLIVDEFTGRILQGRRYSDGLHQALEAKEGVEIERESQTLASITLQNYFRLYKKLAGMTGTALTEAEEFHRIYKLDVISIPTNMPMIRADKPDLVFLTQRSKFNALVNDIKERYTKGQPTLIGTVAIETSELLSAFLTSNNIPHDVLNAKQHEREADIVANAGQKGHITIATNMAGRGTDIKLSPEAVAAGGLYILGTERHESRRIDNQLRGRSGRQGDPGESRFYLSLEDNLIRIFAGDNFKKTAQRMGMTEDDTIESAFFSKNIQKAQERVEKHNFEMRKHLLEYDDVLNQQRMVIYAYRRSILEGQDSIFELIQDLISDAVITIVRSICATRKIESPDQLQQIKQQLMLVAHVPESTIEPVLLASNSDELIINITKFLASHYTSYTKTENNARMQDAQKWLLLETLDGAWKQHMLNLDHLKEGVGLRGYGNKNPLIEYKREAFAMFEDMMKHLRIDVLSHIFHLDLAQFNQLEIEKRRQRELDGMTMRGTEQPGQTALAVKSITPPAMAKNMPGRNEPCPCGSGKKYKKCCGQQ
jgi:preprotein translocase subunit SecA